MYYRFIIITVEQLKDQLLNTSSLF